jgi:hypothetical protein
MFPTATFKHRAAVNAMLLMRLSILLYGCLCQCYDMDASVYAMDASVNTMLWMRLSMLSYVMMFPAATFKHRAADRPSASLTTSQAPPRLKAPTVKQLFRFRLVRPAAPRPVSHVTMQS